MHIAQGNWLPDEDMQREIALGSGEGARSSTEAVESWIHCRLAWGEQLVGSTSHTNGY